MESEWKMMNDVMPCWCFHFQNVICLLLQKTVAQDGRDNWVGFRSYQSSVQCCPVWQQPWDFCGLHACLARLLGMAIIWWRWGMLFRSITSHDIVKMDTTNRQWMHLSIRKSRQRRKRKTKSMRRSNIRPPCWHLLWNKSHLLLALLLNPPSKEESSTYCQCQTFLWGCHSNT